MYKNDCVAMVLAGGDGEPLGALNRYYSSSAIHFGADRRIIDFTLKNCIDSGIHPVGVLSQYFSDELNTYINTIYSDSRERGHMHMLPPQGSPYVATADAVYKNIAFIDKFRPRHVLILAGDHIYKMDYAGLIAFHDQAGADVTIASTRVPLNEAYRYGMMNVHPDGQIYDFEEKPQLPRSRLASMGIYVFRWDLLREYLLWDSGNPLSHHDFGKDIIPAMLMANESMYSYRFDGYWRDAGTLDSLWEANMDQLTGLTGFPAQERASGPESYFRSAKAQVDQSIVAEGCSILGNVIHSVLADSVTVDEGAEIVESVVMPGAYIGENVKLYRTIVGTEAKIMNGAEIGADEGLDVFIDNDLCRGDISLIAPWMVIPAGMRFQKSSQICTGRTRMREDIPPLRHYQPFLRRIV